MNAMSPARENNKDARILVVDDEPSNLQVVSMMLAAEGYEHITLIQDAREALAAYQRERPDVVLLDLNMPHLDGFAVLKLLQAQAGAQLSPVLVLTAQQGREHRLRALEQGARDYLTKPFDRAELMVRVRNLVEVQRAQVMLRDQNDALETRVRERTRELRNTRLQIVQRLGRAAEFRDNETGLHIVRMSHTAALLAKAVGWNNDQCELLLHASPMHDIGKIGIPDNILLKPGKLAPEEWEIMKTHVTIGAHILESDGSELLTLAREIALSHHEKWDGSGYPYNLKGEDIPLVGRIVAIADVFDALTSARSYKLAWTEQAAFDYVCNNSGRHFEPRLVELFIKLLPEALSIQARYAEPETA